MSNCVKAVSNFVLHLVIS